MAGTLFDLYLKYRNKVERSLENDNYYMYLFDLLEASDNTIEQFNRILHKRIDEKWLKMVEDGIGAIDSVLNKPRRFIKSEEHIVPVELAKKINADSVKHLARNTQFISDIDSRGNVMPSKIMSVTTQESYDLYENRFIYALIKKLVRFIDKRTDIIFWSTGDEQESVLKINSEIEDDYEEIEYTLEMRVKNKQSYMQTDAQHMEIFKRIDRVRRIVTEFNRSTFCIAMDGCETVRSPIQKTNLITKDPYYRRCYALWQFLEQYDDIGYTIDVKESAIDFDEDYLYGIYNNIILNYAVFKTLLADDERPIEDTVRTKRKIKPKFVKQIVEEFVDDYDIPDVEIRKVIIEEITKAQAEIERRQAEAEKKRIEKEKKKEKERLAREKAKEAEKAKREKAKAAEKAKQEKAKAAEKAKQEKAKAAERAKLEKAKAAEKARLEKAKAEEKANLEREKAAEKARLEKEKERIAREKAAEKARLEKEKAKEAEKAKREKEKAAEKARLEKEKQKEKERIAREKAKEAEKAKREKEKAAEKVRLEREKQKEKERIAREKAKEAEKAKREKEKAAEKARIEKEKAAEKARLEKEKQKEKERIAKEKAKEAEKAKREKEKAAEKAKREKEKAKTKVKTEEKLEPKEKEDN